MGASQQKKYDIMKQSPLQRRVISRKWITPRNDESSAQATISRLEHIGLNVQLLNITQLSEYRKEARPSFHRKFSSLLMGIANPHLVPPWKTWNELLYSSITLPNVQNQLTPIRS
ncbi:hypothetical protein RJ641_024536 [Dillenia turbinata]|uniref:Uncharacterized protein n=1 Tax=Dillenia turbinata TaxID=194707 RepID=A0AAN8VZW7_9MAGN